MRNYDYREVRDFRRQGHADVERIIKTKRPLVLTTKGKPEVVIQSLASFQEMLETLEAAQSVLPDTNGQDG